MQSIAVVPTIK